MEIIEYKKDFDAKLEQEYTKWISYHYNKKIINEEVVEIRNHNLYFEKEDYNSYQKDNFTYCIKKTINEKIVGMFLYDNDYISISDLILSPEEDWYNIFELIVKYVMSRMSKERHINYLQIYSTHMEHHDQIDNILKEKFKNVVITNRKGQKVWDVMLFDINAKFNDKNKIDIIMYKDYRKEIIIKTFKSRFVLLEKKDVEECGCKCEMSYLMFENPLERCSENEDQPIDINFEINNKIYKNTECNSYKLLSYNRPRLNKLWYCESMYIKPGHEYIPGFEIPLKVKSDGEYEHKVEMKRCFSHVMGQRQIRNEHYCLYELIYTDIGLEPKKIKEIFIPTNIITHNKKFIPNDMEIYDVSELFIEQEIKINKNSNHVYLLEMRDLNIDKMIYKIGQTRRLNPYERMNEYGPAKKIIFLKEVKDAKETEREFKEILDNDVKITKHDFGREYYICEDKDYIIQLLNQCIVKVANEL